MSTARNLARLALDLKQDQVDSSGEGLNELIRVVDVGDGTLGLPPLDGRLLTNVVGDEAQGGDLTVGGEIYQQGKAGTEDRVANLSDIPGFVPSGIAAQEYTADGTQTAFAIEHTAGLVTVALNGVIQESGTFVSDGSQVEFLEAPEASWIVQVFGFSQTDTNKGLFLESYTGDGARTVFQIRHTNNFVIVSLNGVIQQSSTFTSDGAAVTFNDVPGSNFAVQLFGYVE